MRWKTLHKRRTRKLFGPKFPKADLGLLVMCNRFAASREAFGFIVGFSLDERGAVTRYSFREFFYQLKDRILNAKGRPAGLTLQHWTSYADDYHGDEGMEDGCHHYHILERHRLGGRVFHRPTGHFYFSNDLTDYYKQTVGYDELSKQCVETLEGKKRVTRNVPEKSAALAALRRLNRRYKRLPAAERPPRPRVVSGSWWLDRLNANLAREREEKAKMRVQCQWCLETKTGLEVSKVGDKDICHECNTRIFKTEEVEEEIPF